MPTERNLLDDGDVGARERDAAGPHGAAGEQSGDCEAGGRNRGCSLFAVVGTGVFLLSWVFGGLWFLMGLDGRGGEGMGWMKRGEGISGGGRGGVDGDWRVRVMRWGDVCRRVRVRG